MNTIEILKGLLKSYTSDSPLDATREFLSALGICHSVSTDDPIRLFDLYAQTVKSPATEIPKSVKSVFNRVETAWFVGEVNDDSFAGDGEATPFAVAAAKAVEPRYAGMFVFALRMKDGAPLTRTEAAMLTRGFNRIVAHQPATVFIVEGRDVETRLSVATCERTPYKQDWRPGEKLGRVSILKGINCSNPHRGHLDILASMDMKKCKTFDALYAQWQKVFSTDVLTKSFYREIQNWYFWALLKDMHVQFPNDLDDDSDDEKYNAENLIRLITRMIFTWFMKEKGLVNGCLFDLDFLNAALKKFNPEGMVADPESRDADWNCTYYRAILQNLFFATFNQEIGERKFVESAGKKGHSEQHKIKCYYRNAKLFNEMDQQKILAYFAESPFVNGGLFECLDNVFQCDAKKKEHEYSWDGFSNSVRFGDGPRKGALKSALIPNCLFFGSERTVDLSAFYEKAKSAKSVKVRGLINILDSYVFTIEENTPLDEDVALDPELLGKVFENLLGCYNPETRQTARNDSGSFYTPREIVAYMVQESIKAYLVRKVPDVPAGEIERLVDGREDLAQMPSVQEHAEEILLALFKVKILDPACGSGAFPMGIMTEIVSILTKLDPTNKHWHKIVLHESLEEAKKVGAIKNEAEREKRQKEIESAFDTRSRHSDYARKLYVIQHCVFGSDIQPIAVQISRLRFFITLLCEQAKTDDKNDNYGIMPLPNLEHNFVSANSLLSIDIGNMRDVFSPREIRDKRTKVGKNDCAVEVRKQSIIEKVEELHEVRENLFLPKSTKEKADLEERDAKLRKEIEELARDLYDKQSLAELKRYEDELAQQMAKLESLSEEDRHDRTEIKTEMGLFGPMSTKVVTRSPAKEIESTIKDLQFQIEDIKSEGRKRRLLNDVLRLVKWNPFSFNVSEDFLDPEWMFGVANGFDIVIGNPPYVQLSASQGLLGNLYQGCGFETFAKTGDIYCLFYERACQMLRKEGSLCFITSNKWMRAGYGESLRKFLAEKTNPRLLIDFAGQKIFESATVDTNILLADNDVPNQGKTLACVGTDACRENLGDFVKQSAAPCAFTSSESWVILNPIELSIKQKMEKVGKPLKDWDVQINYGIKTGCNEAFIINESTRSEILSNCKDAAERKRTEQLIRPILRGRDIKRYSYEWANLYLIATFPALHLDINDYPAVRDYFLAFGKERLEQTGKTHILQGERIKARKKTCNQWFETQDTIAYWDDFDKPKIVWGNLALQASYAEAPAGLLVSAPCVMIAPFKKYLLRILNSKLADWYIRNLGVTRNGGYFEYKPMFVEELPVPPENGPISNDDDVYSLYGLSESEIAYMKGL